MKRLLWVSLAAGTWVMSQGAFSQTLFKLDFDQASDTHYTSGSLYEPAPSDIVNAQAGGLGKARLYFVDSGASSGADGACIAKPPAQVTGQAQGGRCLLVDSGKGQDEGLRIEVDNPLTSQSFTLETIWFTHDAAGASNPDGCQTIIGDNWPMMNLFGPDPAQWHFFMRTTRSEAAQYFSVQNSLTLPGKNQSYRWYHDALVFDYNAADPSRCTLIGYRNGREVARCRFDGTAYGPLRTPGTVTALFSSRKPDQGPYTLTIGMNNSFEYRDLDHRRGLNGGVDAVAISKGALEPARFVLPYKRDEIPPTHGGKYAMKITNALNQWKDDTGLDMGNRLVEVTEGHKLRLSFWARSATGKAGGIHNVTVAAYNGAGANALRNDRLFSGQKVGEFWTRFTTDYKVPPTATRLSVQFRVAPSDSIVLDDVSLTDSNLSNKALLLNGGFEQWPGEGSFTAPYTNIEGWRMFSVGNAQGRFERLQSDASPKAQAASTPVGVDADF